MGKDGETEGLGTGTVNKRELVIVKPNLEAISGFGRGGGGEVGSKKRRLYYSSG